MNTSHALLGEYLVATAVSSWGALKQKKVPWPGTIVHAGIGFGCLGLVAMATPELAMVLGAGILLALLLKVNWASKYGATPPEVLDPAFPFHILSF